MNAALRRPAMAAVRVLAQALVLGVLAAPAARAVTVGTATVTGSVNFSNITSTNDISVQSWGSVFSGTTFTLANLRYGVTETISDFFTIASKIGATHDGMLPQNMSQTDNIAFRFGVGGGTGAISGRLTETLFDAGTPAAGTLAWNNSTPIAIRLADGDTLLIGLTGSGAMSSTCAYGAEVCTTVGATVKLVKGVTNTPPPHHNPPPNNNPPPQNLPEPGSLLLLATGLLGLGVLRRWLRA